MVERLGEMRKGRRERIEKGSRERIEIERNRKRQKGIGMTSPLASACCSASSRYCGTPPKT